MKYLLASALLLAFTAQAQVYKCESNGQTTYSQVPCGDDAEAVTIDVVNPASADAAAPAQNAATIKASETLDRIGVNIKKRDLDAKIKRLERQAERQARQRDAEVAKINSEKGRYVQNLYGVLHEDKINSAIVAATTIWNTRIDATNQELEKARAEYNKL
ncbi:DUF4124 domain-containing protein [Arsukibacterium indicum]|uniref:DUF4124 domain-containing protein n=1 Tax=Arsukibacterium indicum TaxID=2848612 RepID=A0ABS6MGG9_9GAMM|nr:DUF4124 domain-containing protein [Arsukibacterium indicum]MBV2127921.1 DUF4124 domain-containing protein [Arsukibacterium indicum]